MLGFLFQKQKFWQPFSILHYCWNGHELDFRNKRVSFQQKATGGRGSDGQQF
jgi:hypothetical protein